MPKKKESFNPIKPIQEKLIQLKRLNMGEIPMNILNTMDILYEGKEHKPLVITSKKDGKEGVRKYSGGWHFVFTMNPGCDFDFIKSHQSMFQSVVEGTVEIERKTKFLHINVNNFKWEDTYPFSLITQKIVDKYRNWYLPIPIGVKSGNKMLFVNMEEFSHLMLGGVNNSGKSSWLRQLIMFLKKFRPEVKIVYIDFMRLDARPFKDIVYLGRNINEAHTLLKLTCMEADRRLDILEKSNCFKASEYTGKESMNPIVIPIDELKELEDKDSQEMLEHLSRTARKCGIHLIASLQRPSHTTYKNFTDSRSQFPARLCFQMAEKKDSEIVLSNTKAYYLNKKGRAIWQYNNKEEEIQSLFINNRDLLQMIRELTGENELYQQRGGDGLYELQQNLWLQPR